MFPRDLTNDFRAENRVGAGVASEKQTIKTLEEPPEGPARDVIVRALGPQTLKIIWKVGEDIIYMVFLLAPLQHISPVQIW